MFEVEARGKLTVSTTEIVKRFKKLNAKSLGKTRRFSLIYLRNKSADKNNPVDLRIRVTNGKAEIILKYGKWGAFDSREEVSVPISVKDFSNAVEMLRLIGWTHGVINVNDRYKSIVEGDLKAIDRCDGVLAIMTENSVGTAMELFYNSVHLSKPTYIIMEDSKLMHHPWLKYIASYPPFKNREEFTKEVLEKLY